MAGLREDVESGLVVAMASGVIGTLTDIDGVCGGFVLVQRSFKIANVGTQYDAINSQK